MPIRCYPHRRISVESTSTMRTVPRVMVRSAGGPARFHKASKCVSLPARQLLSAKRATNTTVCPSRRALILGTDTRRRRRTGRWWRHWSFPHPPVFREERDARRQSNNEKRRRHEDQRVSSGRCSACFPQDVCIFLRPCSYRTAVPAAAAAEAQLWQNDARLWRKHAARPSPAADIKRV